MKAPTHLLSHPFHSRLLHTADDALAVAGIGALLLAACDLPRPTATPGLLVLAGLALAVRLYPLVRAYPPEGGGATLAVTAATPTLAIMALYGPRWAIVVAGAALALDGTARARRWLAPLRGVRRLARGMLALTLAGAAFTATGGQPGQLALAALLPALAAAAVALALGTWLLAAPVYARASDNAYRDLVREGVIGALPAVAAEPVLAFVLALAATAPSAATLLAAVLPLVGLMAALRLHAERRGRLRRAHAALRQAHAQLHLQATTDPLTGLANRRHFEELLAGRLDEAARYRRPVSVLLLDLDSFKRINDTYGHAGGDAVLVAVAGALRRGLRRTDLPARLGGDEFVALLPETDAGRAVALAERVCAEVAGLTVPAGTGVVRPSASVGVASTDGHGRLDPAGLLAAADGAAYAAKAAGKNTVRLAVDPETERVYLHAHDYVCTRPTSTRTLTSKAAEQEGYGGNVGGLPSQNAPPSHAISAADR